MEPANESWEHMGVFRMKVVISSIQISRHGADEIAFILATISLAHFDASNLGEGVRFVGGFKRAAQ